LCSKSSLSIPCAEFLSPVLSFFADRQHGAEMRSSHANLKVRCSVNYLFWILLGSMTSSGFLCSTQVKLGELWYHVLLGSNASFKF
jgi:hypothetical protein